MEGMYNLIGNLQQITQSDNLRKGAMSIKSDKSPSKYRGVSRPKDRPTWRAAIVVNKTRIHLGTFKNEIDAAIAHDEGAKEHHGRFAVLNFPS